MFNTTKVSYTVWAVLQDFANILHHLLYRYYVYFNVAIVKF